MPEISTTHGRINTIARQMIYQVLDHSISIIECPFCREVMRPYKFYDEDGHYFYACSHCGEEF